MEWKEAKLNLNDVDWHILNCIYSHNNYATYSILRNYFKNKKIKSKNNQILSYFYIRAETEKLIQKKLIIKIEHSPASFTLNEKIKERLGYIAQQYIMLLNDLGEQNV